MEKSSSHFFKKWGPRFLVTGGGLILLRNFTQKNLGFNSSTVSATLAMSIGMSFLKKNHLKKIKDFFTAKDDYRPENFLTQYSLVTLISVGSFAMVNSSHKKSISTFFVLSNLFTVLPFLGSRQKNTERKFEIQKEKFLGVFNNPPPQHALLLLKAWKDDPNSLISVLPLELAIQILNYKNSQKNLLSFIEEAFLMNEHPDSQNIFNKWKALDIFNYVSLFEILIVHYAAPGRVRKYIKKKLAEHNQIEPAAFEQDCDTLFSLYPTSPFLKKLGWYLAYEKHPSLITLADIQKLSFNR